MTEPPPLGGDMPALMIVLHLPGIDLVEPIMKVAGVWVRRLRWIDWNLIESSDEAWRLHYAFKEARHVFCAVFFEDFTGTPLEAKAFVRNLVDLVQQRLLMGCRLHKTGAVIDPRSSTLYLRLGSLNVRQRSDYGLRLLDYPAEPRYVIGPADLAAIAYFAEQLDSIAAAPDPGVQLALRSFGFAYGYGLSATQRLSFLFTALEAVFGEYRRQNRPRPRVTLGAAAATVSREADPAALKAFLDGAGAARGLRNAIAHGDIPVIADDDPVILRVEEIVRDGLRALVAFAAQHASFLPQLDHVEASLASAPPKAAFQHVLSHAARGSSAAIGILTAILAQLPSQSPPTA